MPDQAAISSAMQPYAIALIGLAGALVGSVGSAAVTIYINYRQRSDYFARELWSQRIAAYKAISTKLNKSAGLITHLATQIEKGGAEFLYSEDGLSYGKRFQNASEELAATLRDNIWILTPDLRKQIDQFRSDMVALDDARRRHDLLGVNALRASRDQHDELFEVFNTHVRRDMRSA